MEPEFQTQPETSNQPSNFAYIIISILLTAVIAGLGVDFWIMMANSKAAQQADELFLKFEIE